MNDDDPKSKTVDGVVVEETITGRLVRRGEPLVISETPRAHSPEELALLAAIDFQGIERRIVTHCEWVGALYDEDEEKAKAEALKPENRRIILTDEYE